MGRLDEICPDFEKWPETWKGMEEELVYGENLLKVFRPFAEMLVFSGLTKKTIRSHLGNLWQLGGEVVSHASMQNDLEGDPLEHLAALVDKDGGPYCRHLYSRSERESFDRTCRKLAKFLDEKMDHEALPDPVLPGVSKETSPQPLGKATKKARGPKRPTLVVDLGYLVEDMKHVSEVPGPALNLALFIGSIVAWMSSRPLSGIERTNVPCRRSPARKRCRGEILAFLDEDEILWRCPECEDNGWIRGWRGTPWDRGW